MVDKNVLNDEFGGFDSADSETFALEGLTAYPGESEGFIIPKPQPEILSEEITPQKTEIPEMAVSTFEQQIMDSDPIEENISIDDDLLRALQQDLIKSKQKKELIEEEQPPIEEQDFIEFEHDSNTETIDLADIKAEHPSSFMAQEEPAQASEVTDIPDSSGYGGYGGYAALAQDIVSENSDTIPPIVEDSRKKEKKSLPFFNKKTLLIAASIAGITVLGLSAYMLTPAIKGVFASKDTDSTNVENHDNQAHKKEEEHKTKDEHKPDAHAETKPHSDDKAITAISDSLLDEITDDTKHDEHVAEAKSHNSATVHEKPKQDDKKHSEEKHAEPKHEPKQIKEKHPENEHKSVKENIAHHKEKDDKHSTQSAIKKHPQKNTIAKKEHHEKEIPYETKQKVEETPVKKEQATTSDKVVKPLFTIQVYATPSKNEAERWLNKLRSSSANAPVITTQQIRDKTWYRVRFGNFSSRDEAEKAIRSLGYDQCWIDRVR